MLHRDDDPLRKRYMYDIDEGVPCESQVKYKYPFHLMKVSDSFFIPLGDRTELNIRGSVTSAAWKGGWKISVRRRKEKMNGRYVEGLRVWLLGRKREDNEQTESS